MPVEGRDLSSRRTQYVVRDLEIGQPINSEECSDVAGMLRGKNRRSRKDDTHDRGSGQAAWHTARFTHLTIAGESLHAPVRAGMEDARAGAKPRLSYRDLCRRPRDPVPEGQSRRGLATTARD